MITIPSKEQIDEERRIIPIPHDDYELTITNTKEEKQNKYMAKPDKDGKTPQEDVVNIEMEIKGTRDGDLVADEEGNDATGRKIFFTARPKNTGFMKDGTPSKTRCLVAYAMGQSVDGTIELTNWEDLLGKTIFAEIIQKDNMKGKKVNRISRFLMPKKSKTKKAETETKAKSDEIRTEDIPF